MKRILITIEYDGTDYAGWQRQRNGASIQQTLEECLKKVTGEQIRITGAGRTDAGVHARGQAAHFDTGSPIPAERFAYAMNFHLPESIRVTYSEEVPEGFSARFRARAKWYRYTIYNHPHPSALDRSTRLHVREPLDTGAMNTALKDILGRHDFSAFAASGGTHKTAVRTIFSATVSRQRDEVNIDITGDAFLFNMVRIIAGTLIDIGKHRLGTDALRAMIDTGSRLHGGATAPAKGLTLMKVYYAWPDAAE
jgi:tRNA pseudouridine38-40 synthase